MKPKYFSPALLFGIVAVLFFLVQIVRQLHSANWTARGRVVSTRQENPMVYWPVLSLETFATLLIISLTVLAAPSD